MQLNQEFIKKNISEITFLNSFTPKIFSFSVDTRTIKKDEIFVALKGNHVDGHDFLKEALKSDAGGLFIAQEKKSLLAKLDQNLLAKKVVMIAADPFKALTDLAAAWRAQFTIPVIGITGSVGKTSTKEIIGNILALDGRSHLISKENQNTLLGASLNVLRMSSEHTIAVFEMGISHRGEMARLAELIKPSAAVITNVGHCHMEGLGSIIDIACEKRDIFKYFKESSIGIINGDLPLLSNVAYRHPVIKFGSKTTNQVQARKVNSTDKSTNFVLKLYGEKHSVILQNNHSGAVFNALAAVAVAYYLQISVKTILQAIQMPVSIAGRFVEKPFKAGKGTVIDDSYNANPESMKAALLAFDQIKTKAQKVAIIGDMLELGVNSAFWHRQIGRFLRKTPSVRNVILVGSFVEATKKTIPVGLKVEHVATWQEAKQKLVLEFEKDAMILVKGSLGMKLKNLVDELT